jgi:hypothetical protein
MTTRKVFISHSAKRDRCARVLLGQLSDALAKRNFEVLVDLKSLRSGRPWEPGIRQWLATCNAAVILLGKKALKSEWVVNEAAALLQRQHMLRQAGRRELFILPVLIGGVQLEDVRKAQGLRLLCELEFMCGPATLDAAALAEQIADRFAAVPADRADEGPMGDWVRRIAYEVGRVEQEDHLVEAACALGISAEESARVREFEGHVYLAERLLSSALCRHTVNAVAKLTPFMPADAGRALVDEMAPTWVDETAAQLILQTTPVERLVALLNSRSHETGEYYFARATCRANVGYWHDVVGAVTGEAPGAQGAMELLREWQGALERELIVDPARPGERPPYRCFLIVDPRGMRLEVVAAAIQEMNNRYPWLGILLLTGDSMPDAATVRAWQLTNLVPLLPQLTASAEFEARRLLKDLNRLVKRS